MDGRASRTHGCICATVHARPVFPTAAAAVRHAPMSRLPRLAVGGHPHLVLQRGLPSQPIFVDESDRRLFVDLLRDAARQHHVDVHAYALLDDQVRLLVTPASAGDLSVLMQSIGRRYVAAFNRRHMRSGTLWQGRFRAAVVDAAAWLLAAMRFVEAPGGLVAASGSAHASAGAAGAPSLARSSLAHHLGQQASPLVTSHPAYWQLGNTPFEREAAYRRLVEFPLPPADAARLQGAADKGWALGSERFVLALSESTERRLGPLRRGRPPKVLARGA